MHAYDNGARRKQQEAFRAGIDARTTVGGQAEPFEGRQFSQAPVSAAEAQSLVNSIDIVEALGTVLDLSFLVDDVSDEERDARTLIATVVASATRVIKSNLDQDLATADPA
jgi:hypothetical protein